MSYHHVPNYSRVLAPTSGPDFNHITGDGESLLKIMKDRGCIYSLIQSI